jgi:hypothetical protein
MSNPFAGILRDNRLLIIKWQLLGTASVLGALAVGFLALAADRWLSERIGPPAAAAATAGLLILTALAVVGIAAIVSACGAKSAPRERGVDTGNIAELAVTLIDLSQKLESEVRSSVKPLTIAALVVGCAVGYSPALRRTLKDLVG